MNKPHKHADLIKAWADGADIEVRCITNYNNPSDCPWTAVEELDDVVWRPEYEYRIKPKKPYVVDLYAEGKKPGQNWLITGMYASHRANVRFSFDPDTQELLSVEKI